MKKNIPTSVMIFAAFALLLLGGVPAIAHEYGNKGNGGPNTFRQPMTRHMVPAPAPVAHDPMPKPRRPVPAPMPTPVVRGQVAPPPHQLPPPAPQPHPQESLIQMFLHRLVDQL